MKKMICMLLVIALWASLCGCAGGEGSATPAPTAAVTPEHPGTPLPTPEDTPAVFSGSAVRVEITRESETLTDDAGTDTLLSYTADRAHVTLPDNAEAEARINATLDEDYRLFAEGDADLEWSGKAAFADSAREEYGARLADGTKESFYPYELSRRVDVTRGDDRVLCLTYLDYSYTGGAHGYSSLGGVSFDLRSGERLSLEDLSDDPEAFLRQCAELLWEDSRSGEHVSLALGGYYPDYEQDLPDLLTDGNWYFSDEGIVVIANPYAIAPYSWGRIEFTLPWDALRWQMKEEYLPAAQQGFGTLTGEICPEAPAADYVLDDGTNGAGACVVFTADGPVEDIRVTRVQYWEHSGSFTDDGELWYASHMNDGETLLLRTWIGDVLPTRKISWRREGAAREEYLVFQSGKDGSLVLMDAAPMTTLPREISGELPFAYDVDGDGAAETLDLMNTGENGGTHWVLTVDGQRAGDAYAMDAALLSLWLTDLDADGVCEILFSGDMGSDDYITCAWRGDTLAVIPFTGEARRGRDPAEQTASVDGRAVISGWQLYLESWSYQLGTYNAVRAYEYADGVIAPAHDTWTGFDGWSYTRNRTWLTVTKPVMAQWPDGGEAALEIGTEILLQGTEGDRALFLTRDGRSGALELEYTREPDGYFAGWTIDGLPEDEYFAMLPYAG